MADNEDLRNQLQTLHDDLEKALKVTAIEKDVWGHVMGDMVRIYEGEELRHHEEPRSLREVLEARESQYEVAHPRIAGIVRQILDILAKMGI